MARSPLRVNLLAFFNDKGVKQAQRDLRSLGRTVESLGGTALKAGAAFAAFNIGRGLVDFAGTAVSEASDLVRNLNGLESVFGELTPIMTEFTEQAYLMGLSQNEASKAVTFLGSVLKQSGFEMQTTSKLTKELVALGTDLAITYGYDVQEALLGMTALFRGEYDPIEKFGVAMKQSEVDAELLARGLGNLGGAEERFAQQLVRVQFLFERARDAMGQFQVQTGTLFVEQQILEAQMRNLSAEIGGPLLQAFGQLIEVFRPLIVDLGPVLTGMFAQLIVVIQNLVLNKDIIIEKFKEFAGAVGFVASVMIGLTMFVVNNIEAISRLAVAVVILFGVMKTIAVVTTVWTGMTAAIALAAKAVGLLNISLNLTVVAIRAIKIALVATGVGALLVGLGLAAEFVMNKFSSSADELAGFGDQSEQTQAQIDELMASLDASRVEGFQQATQDEIEKMLEEAQFSGDALFGAAGAAGSGAAARDGVRTFYSNLADEAEKQKAKLRLESLGATPALIDSILGSGDQWRQVFDSVVANGTASVRAVQDLFASTAAGYQEAMAKFEEEVLGPFKQFKQEAEAARDSFVDFVDAFRILPSIESDLGKFEAATVSHLESIEENLKEAFDNGYLLEESYRNLQEYARAELGTLRQIERQRDEILARRDASQRLIEQVQDSVRASGNLVNLLRDVQNEAEKVDVLAFTREALTAGGELRAFSVALISNFIDPIDQARGKSDLLVQGFRGVVERTREYVENLKALRALGLDPLLFNQLVQAGVEAGGETAKALIDGGADTITEINGLFRELDRLGEELGENTAQVMYGQGEKFVDGIVNGLAAQASELEGTANALAEAFTTTFESVLIAGIDRAIAAAEAALARMPQVPDMDFTPTRPTPPGPPGPPSQTTTPPFGSGIFADLRPPQLPTFGNLLFQATRPQVPQTPLARAGIPAPGTGILSGISTTNIFTSASPSAVANSITRYTNTNPSQRLSSTALRSLKSTG
jgi:hypothetical protein